MSDDAPRNGTPGKIFARLLRLYPAGFRERYGDEAMQLLRDRLRDERGFFARIRLWRDVLWDLTISVPREWRRIRRPAASSSAQTDPAGMPSFQMLERETLRPGAFLAGGAGSVVAFGLCCALMSHYQSYRPAADSSGAAASPPSVEQPAAAHGQVAADGPATPPPKAPVKPSNMAQAATADERQRVVRAAATNLKRFYTDSATAQKTAEAILKHAKAGDYDYATDGKAFAALVTRHMREASRDMDLMLVYIPGAQRSGGMSATARRMGTETGSRTVGSAKWRRSSTMLGTSNSIRFATRRRASLERGLRWLR